MSAPLKTASLCSTNYNPRLYKIPTGVPLSFGGMPVFFNLIAIITYPHSKDKCILYKSTFYHLNC